MVFEIIFYENENGQNSVKEFLKFLPKKHCAKAYWSIELLKRFGTNLTESYIKNIKRDKYKGLWELRIKVASNISRILYFMPVGNTIVLLHGFIKKTEDTLIGELEIAKIYLEDYMDRITRKKGVSWKDVKTELLQDGEFTKAVKEIDPKYELISQIIEARIEQKITQNELAQRVNTKQSKISRLESGEYNPTIIFLKKIAEGLGMELHVSFKPKLQ